MNPKAPRESFFLPDEERMVVGICFCDLRPRVLVEIPFPEISFWGLRDHAQEKEERVVGGGR